jgi:serpin B
MVSTPVPPARRIVAALLAASTLMAACGGDDDTASGDDGPEPTPAGVDVVKADLDRDNARGDAPVDQVVAGLRTFAVKLAAADEGASNLVVSPTSIAVAFAMAEAGADAPTADAITQVFGFPAQPGVHEAMNALTAKFEAANHAGNAEGSEGVTLELANAIWGQTGLEFGQEFLDTLATQYGAGVDTVDFAADPEAARQAINAWVSQITRERIPELLQPGMVDPETVVALVNAIYLKAAWQTPFDEGSTSDQPYKLTPTSTVNVPTMHDAMLYTEATVGGGYTAVKLPYEGNELAMVVIVPDEPTSLADFEAGLTGERLAEIVTGLEPAAVDLSLPRFEASSALDLAGPLTALGLPIPGGDLTGIAPGTQIGAAVHAANITVDEKGTEAAAATAIMGLTSAPGEITTIRVDRPFLFLIQHEETGAPLFYGRITDPRG